MTNNTTNAFTFYKEHLSKGLTIQDIMVKYTKLLQDNGLEFK